MNHAVYGDQPPDPGYPPIRKCFLSLYGPGWNPKKLLNSFIVE
jgi:hypothetical protein